MKELLPSAKKYYDYIVLNSSAISIFSEVWVLSNFTDKTILIEDQDKEMARDAQSRLGVIGADVFISKPDKMVQYSREVRNVGFEASIA